MVNTFQNWMLFILFLAATQKDYIPLLSYCHIGTKLTCNEQDKASVFYVAAATLLYLSV